MELAALHVVLVNQQLPYIQSLYVVQQKSHKHDLVVKTLVYMLRETMLMSEISTAKYAPGFTDGLTTELLSFVSTWKSQNFKGLSVLYE